MKRWIKPLALVLCLLATPALASAALITNSDSSDYELVFEQGNGQITATVRAGKSLAFRCVRLPCKITLKKTSQTVKLTSSSQDVVINNGRLVVKETRKR